MAPLLKSIGRLALRHVSRLVSSVGTLLLSIALYLFGRFSGTASGNLRAMALYATMADLDLDSFQTRPRKVTVAHQQIAFHRYGWFQEEVYHVPLEVGATILSRKIASRHRGKTFGCLLLVHGFSQNRHSWDLEGRSFVNYLAEAGYDVFFLDLRGNRESLKLGSPAARSIQEVCWATSLVANGARLISRSLLNMVQYVEIDVRQALKLVKAVTSHKKVYLVGHSMVKNSICLRLCLGGKCYSPLPLSFFAGWCHLLRCSWEIFGFCWGRGSHCRCLRLHSQQEPSFPELSQV